MSDALKADRGAVADFLNIVHPCGPWVLTAIPGARAATDTRTFHDADAATCWAVAQNADERNIYWTVNRIRGAVDKKPKKDDVEEAVFLHVDIDPRKGEDVAAEQSRIHALLHGFDPAPTIIVFSGGGYQALWRLDEPLYIGGTAERWEELEAYNRQLQAELGGDNCHNIDRVLRVAGTVNWPDETKRKKGRQPALATLVSTGEVHPLRAFTPAPAPAAGAAAGQAGAAVVLPADLPRADLDALPPGISQRTRMLIVQGNDPDDPTRYGSKSEAMWAVACELVRAGCTDEQIAAVLLDPDLGISEHPLRQKRSLEYVARQIERARQEAPAGGRRVLDSDDPYGTALRFREELYPHTLHTNGDFLTWRAGAYRAVEDATMESDAYRELAAAVVRKKRGDDFVYVPFKPKKATVQDYLQALRRLVHQPIDRVKPPAWIDAEGPPPLELIALRNGLLHVPTGELLPPNPSFFTRNALDIDFAPDAPLPAEWLRFVAQVFPDPAAAALLQEWFGYLLLPDTSQEKMLLMVGPPRSGKGTIQKVLTELVGMANVCAPSIQSLGTGFGLQPMIGKQVAFLSDIRIGRASDREAITSTLLRITGQDDVTADRKNREAWTGRLAVRFVIATNELPELKDNSPALANRFTPLIMEKSFLGREDLGLAARIVAAEMPGVLRWALEGWLRLRERGRFALPVASEEAIAEIMDLGSPVAAFVHARCDLATGNVVAKNPLYQAYRQWCEESEQRAVAYNMFCRDLGTATNGKVQARKTRAGASDGGRVPVFEGIALRDEPGPDGGQTSPEPGPAALPFGSGAQWEREPY